MYDYINVIDNKESTVITFAYATPKDGNIRMETFVNTKAYNSFTKTEMTTLGDKTIKVITSAEYYHTLGSAIGEFTRTLPGCE